MLKLHLALVKSKIITVWRVMWGGGEGYKMGTLPAVSGSMDGVRWHTKKRTGIDLLLAITQFKIQYICQVYVNTTFQLKMDK
jgi:hypothetical protein